MRSLAPAVIVYHTRLNGRKFSAPNGEAMPIFQSGKFGQAEPAVKGALKRVRGAF